MSASMPNHSNSFQSIPTVFGNSNNKIKSLQAGRAIASLAVVFNHAAVAAAEFVGPFAGLPIFRFGYLGVDFFFVLSGFIIFHSTVGRGKTGRKYANSRFKRIYLPYVPVGVCMALLYTFRPQLGSANANWTWLASLTLAPITSRPALTVAWSLQYEVMFYVIFGLGYFTNKLMPLLAIWGMAIVIAIIAGAGSSYLPLSPINLEFFMGIAAAGVTRKNWGPNWLFAGGAAAFCLWLALGADRGLSPLVGLAFALALPPIILLENRGKLVIPQWLVFMGAASYAIYLIHNPAVSVVARLHITDRYALFIAAIVLSTAAGVAYHWFFERPLMRFRFRPAPAALKPASAAPNE